MECLFDIVLIIAVCLMAFIFCGEPDLHDAIVARIAQDPPCGVEKD